MDTVNIALAGPFPWMNIAAFTFAAGLLSITPGTDTALIIRTAAVASTRRAIEAGLGICLGILIWSALVAAGIGAILIQFPTFYETLRWLGCLYLGWLGVRLLLQPRHSLDENIASSSLKQRHSFFLTGLFTNLLNPKVGVFYLSFLPQFIPAYKATSIFPFLLGGIHAIETAIWIWLLLVALRPILKFLRKESVLMTLDRLTGAVFIAFGIRLAFDRGH